MAWARLRSILIGEIDPDIPFIDMEFCIPFICPMEFIEFMLLCIVLCIPMGAVIPYPGGVVIPVIAW